MSGGAYSYLCYADSFCGHEDDLDRMAERLDALGLPDAAAQTRALLPLSLDSQDPLRVLWHAVEWKDSLDYSDDQLAKAVEEWASTRA